MTEENKKEQSFEEAMGQLEIIVKKLEENEVPLEEAINLFQEGMSLSAVCHQRLQRVEDKMDQILEANGDMKPFNIQGEDI